MLWSRNFSISTPTFKPKTGILMLNMGGPQTTDQVHDYLLRIMTDRDMIQLPFQRFVPSFFASYKQFVMHNSIPVNWDRGLLNVVRKKFRRSTRKLVAGHQYWNGPIYRVICFVKSWISYRRAQHRTSIMLASAMSIRWPRILYSKSKKTHQNESLSFHNIRNIAVPRLVPVSIPFTNTTGRGLHNENFIVFHLIIDDAFAPRDFPKNIKWSVIDRWATHPLLVKTFAERIKDQLKKFPEDVRNDVIILFSAHSLPLKVSIVS